MSEPRTGPGPDVVAGRIHHYLTHLEHGGPPSPRRRLERHWRVPEGPGRTAADVAARQRIQADRAFATLTEGSLALLVAAARGRRVLDLGAGAGHLVRVLRAHGLEALGIDRERAVHDEVLRVRAETWLPANARPDDLLVLSWPPLAFETPDLGETAVRALVRGQRLAYLGEPGDGCTGTPAFHGALFATCRRTAAAPLAPLVPGIHDELGLWERR